MTNNAYMSPAIDREKNFKASAYTAVVCVVVFILFFFTQWTLPVIPPPPFEEGIEVNLGNSDEGLGDIAPQMPGDPSDVSETAFNPPAASQPAAPSQDNQSITGDENEEDDNTEVSNVPKPVVKNTRVNNIPRPVVRNTAPANNNNNTARPVENKPVAVVPTPAPPKPKAVYSGGTSAGSGGNGADSYNGVRNQGIAGGNGDQGKPNGNPNSDSYQGNGGRGTSGVRIKSGLSNRRFTKLPTFEDDFNENASVAVNIKVNREGRVISAVVNLSGTTTANANIRSIATRKAMQLKMNEGSEEEQTGTIIFSFKLRG